METFRDSLARLTFAVLLLLTMGCENQLDVVTIAAADQDLIAAEGNASRALWLTDLGVPVSVADIERMGPRETEILIATKLVEYEERVIGELRGPNPPLHLYARPNITVEEAIERSEGNILYANAILDFYAVVANEQVTASFMPTTPCEDPPDITRAVTHSAISTPLLSKHIHVHSTSFHVSDRLAAHEVSGDVSINNNSTDPPTKVAGRGTSASVFEPCMRGSPRANVSISVHKSHPQIHLLCAKATGNHKAHGAGRTHEVDSEDPRGCVHLT